MVFFIFFFALPNAKNKKTRLKYRKIMNNKMKN